MKILNCTEKDIDKIRQFVNQNKPLGLHTPFTYWVIFKYFGNTCFKIMDKNKVIGYTCGLKSSYDQNVLYLWQIGVLQSHRGKKYSHLLLNKIIESCKKLKCSKIQFSIEPDNHISYKNLSKYAQQNNYFIKKIDEIKYVDTLSGKQELEYLYEMKI